MEIEIIKFFQSHKSIFFDIFFAIFSFLGSFIGFVLLFFIIFYFTKNTKHKYLSFYFAINYFILILFNYILKMIINRPRPYEADKSIISILTASGKSFPSGHMASATIIVFFALYLVFMLQKNKSFKILSAVFGLLFLCVVAISRMYLGQHYPTDLFGGFAISAVYSMFSIFMYCIASCIKNFSNKFWL